MRMYIIVVLTGLPVSPELYIDPRGSDQRRIPSHLKAASNIRCAVVLPPRRVDQSCLEL